MSKHILTEEQNANFNIILDVVTKKRNINDSFFAAMEALDLAGVDYITILKEEHGYDVNAD